MQSYNMSKPSACHNFFPVHPVTCKILTDNFPTAAIETKGPTKRRTLQVVEFIMA